MNVTFIGAGADSYVLCELAGAIYAVRSDDIEHLEMVGQITPVPNAPPFVDGVTSVRGRGASGSSSRLCQPSSSAWWRTVSKRPSGLEAAPRPLIPCGGSCDMRAI